MKLKIKSDGDWTNTYAFLNEEDISDEIEALTIHVLAGEYASLHVKIKRFEDPIQFYSTNFALNVFEAKEIPK